MTELKPCPFCGGEVLIYGSGKYVYWKHKEKSGIDCILITPEIIHGAKSLAEGYKKWNRRATDEKINH